jgi:peptidoglycan/xylan/chitin deacetylase (PgdA/CDA1 family)
MFRYKASLALNKNAELYKAAINARNETALKAVIANDMDADFENFLKDYKPYMTSEQIRSLIAQGFSIGSHSCSHPYYEDLSIEKQVSQTVDCLDVLQKDFQIKEKLFAFPFTDHGVSKKFFEQILDSGKIDFSFGGAGIKKDIHPRQFQRIPMEGWGASAEQIIKSEYLYYLLRAPLFRNTIKRN